MRCLRRKAACLVLAVLPFLGPSMPEAHGRDRLVILSPHWEGYRTETETAYRRWHSERFGTDVDISWRDVGGGSDALKFALMEFQQRPQGIGIDLFFGGGLDPYLTLKAKGLLEPFPLPEDIRRGIPDTVAGVAVIDPENEWFGVSLAGFGILENRRVVKIRQLPQVRTWEDLADPRLFSWVGSGDPRASGSAAMMFEIILQAYGWEKGWQVITGMSGNIRAYNKNSSMAAKDATFGEVAYALAIDVYGLNQVSTAGPENMAFLYPEGLTILNPDAIAILKGAPHPEQARRFVTFMLSEHGQKLWVLPRGAPGGPVKFDVPRLSVRPDLYPLYAPDSGFMNPFAARPAFTFDPRRSKMRREALQGLVGATVIDLHAELVEAWRKLIGRNLPPEQFAAAWAELSRPPVSEAELDEAAANRWSDARERSRLLQRWQDQAFQKYRRMSR